MSLKTLSEHFCAEWPSGQKFQQKHDKFFNQFNLICPIIDCSANLPILATIWSMLKTIVESINIDLIPGVHKWIANEGAWDVDGSLST